MDSPADPLEVEKLLAAARRLQAAGKATAAARAFAAVDRLLGVPFVTRPEPRVRVAEVSVRGASTGVRHGSWTTMG